MKNDLLKQLVRAYVQRDDAAFQSTMRTYVAEQRARGSVVLARDLERLLDQPRPPLVSPDKGLMTAHEMRQLPLAQGDRAPLGDWRMPSHSLADLVLPAADCATLDRVVQEWSHRSLLAEHGLSPARKLLFHRLDSSRLGTGTDAPDISGAVSGEEVPRTAGDGTAPAWARTYALIVSSGAPPHDITQ